MKRTGFCSCAVVPGGMDRSHPGTDRAIAELMRVILHGSGIEWRRTRRAPGIRG